MDTRDIAAVAEEISKESEVLVQLLRNTQPRGLSNDASHLETELWNHPRRGSDIERSQSKLLGLTERLDRTLRGTQDVLHEFVASNWDRGALYCLLEHGVLEHLPRDGSVSLAELAEKTAISADKLLPILRLAACGEIVQEPAPEVFQHGPISRELVSDPGLKAFIGFQYCHIGSEVFHPEKGIRFRAAMESVTSALDPGNQLLKNWFSCNVKGSDRTQLTFVDITRFPMQESHFLAQTYPSVVFEVQRFPEDLSLFAVEDVETAHNRIYTLNSILWNLPDNDCIAVLRVFLPHLKKSPNSVLLINDLMSPAPGTFDPHVDKAYRRRDVTVMTMHNAKLRTETEWLHIFFEASPNFKIIATTGYTSHSCRALWELGWDHAKSS
ncbi:hypothetical protein G7Z17_g4419 [Cylindrodendrum hubeiense]|uniref:O-methyltransferase n=1 Tax=Cylindrodendrum hubeiense TaxID=595255 RepID=A0A9P5HG21_9HYPO|nr:hypothetical protein G7Z17_g4419 [Cylindrodendrum hubeiense]